MKKGFLLNFPALLFFVFSHQAYAGTGFFDSFAIVDANGSTTFYDLGATTGNPNYQGQANLGNMSPSSHLLILGGQIKTFKNNGTDVTGVSIFYRIYPQGSPSGSFTEIPYGFQFNLGNPGDQQWGTDVNGSNTMNLGVNVLAGSTLTAGTYTLEVYVRATTNGVDAPTEFFDSNGGSNYQADFVVIQTLPVELTTFSGKVTKAGNALSWSTASELNNSHFEIQRSKAGKAWQAIGKVQGAGTTLETQTYAFVDENPLPGVNYYRLKQVDVDGTFDYSDAIQLVAKTTLVQIFPNPVGEVLNYQLADVQEVERVQLFDVNGKLVRETTAVTGQLSMTDLPKGVYLFVLETAGKRVQQRIVKQ